MSTVITSFNNTRNSFINFIIYYTSYRFLFFISKETYNVLLELHLFWRNETYEYSLNHLVILKKCHDLINSSSVVDVKEWDEYRNNSKKYFILATSCLVATMNKKEQEKQQQIKRNVSFELHIETVNMFEKKRENLLGERKTLEYVLNLSSFKRIQYHSLCFSFWFNEKGKIIDCLNNTNNDKIKYINFIIDLNIAVVLTVLCKDVSQNERIDILNMTAKILTVL